MSNSDSNPSKTHKFTFDLTLPHLFNQMTALHYACEFPSLSMIIDLLGQQCIDPLALDNNLLIPSDLIPLSHLTSKKCVVIVEKDHLIKKFFSVSSKIDESRQLESEINHINLDVPSEKDNDFDFEEPEHTQPTTQKPRCFPDKKTFSFNMRLPSEKVIGRGITFKTDRAKEDNKFNKKGGNSLEDFRTLRKSMNGPPSIALIDKKPLRMSLKETPALQIKSIKPLKNSSGEREKLHETLSLHIERVVLVIYIGIHFSEVHMRQSLSQHKVSLKHDRNLYAQLHTHVLTAIQALLLRST